MITDKEIAIAALKGTTCHGCIYYEGEWPGARHWCTMTGKMTNGIPCKKWNSGYKSDTYTRRQKDLKELYNEK